MDIQNAYVFVADALRYDYLPEQVASMGHEMKCVASSTISPTSFSSILSGMHPPNHGVWTFEHALGNGDNKVLDANNFNGSFWQRNPTGEVGEQAIFDVLGHTSPQNQLPVSDISPPFLLVERDATTHSPYGKYTQGNDMPDASEFIKSIKENTTLKKVYEDAANQTAEIFKERVQTLKERGLLEDTLIIFTSDHGELLGECGQTSHGTPVTQELVYVPTVAVHPDGKQPRRPCVSHTDIIPTIFDFLDEPIPPDIDGHSIYKKADEYILNYTEYKKPEYYTSIGRDQGSGYEYSVRGAFDENGGWFFTDSTLTSRLRAAIPGIKSSLERSPTSVYKALRQFTKSERKTGSPNIEREVARAFITDIQKNAIEVDGSSRNLSIGEEQKKRLEDLGYK